jgi:hypothetical protein
MSSLSGGCSAERRCDLLEDAEAGGARVEPEGWKPSILGVGGRIEVNASRLACLVSGLVLAVVGFFCLNYTKGFDMEHHVQWAAAHDFPAPSYPIFLAGAGLGALGAALIGHALGSKSRRD